MSMPELTKQQKAALVVSRMARTVAHHEAAHAPKKLRFEHSPQGEPEGPARVCADRHARYVKVPRCAR